VVRADLSDVVDGAEGGKPADDVEPAGVTSTKPQARKPIQGRRWSVLASALVSSLVPAIGFTWLLMAQALSACAKRRVS
jgi:hypothetical protein